MDIISEIKDRVLLNLFIEHTEIPIEKIPDLYPELGAIPTTNDFKKKLWKAYKHSHKEHRLNA